MAAMGSDSGSGSVRGSGSPGDVAGQAPGDAAWSALGTGVRLRTVDPRALAVARAVLEAELTAIDEVASRFRPDSEVIVLVGAGGRAVAVSPLLAEALAQALRAARLTHGALDPTVGSVLVDLGYDRDFRSIPPGQKPQLSVRRPAGWQSVELDVAAGTVRVPAGTLLDLGATAKAFVADRAAARAAEVAGCGVLVSLGGDVAVAGPAPVGGWRIWVTDDSADPGPPPPREPPDPPDPPGPPDPPDPPGPAGDPAAGQLVTISSGGLATSSTTVRRWGRRPGGGTALHHLINPVTCVPAESPWRTVSVAAGSCLDANIASTATVVLAERGAQWLHETGLPARLVGQDGTVRHLAGWPEPPR